MPPPSDGSGMRRVGKAMSVIGAVIAVVSIAVAVAGFFGIKAMVERGIDESYEVGSSIEVVLEEGESRWIDADGGSGPQVGCRVLGPGNGAVLVDWLGEYSNTSRPAAGDLGVFTATADGMYRVTCSGPGDHSLGPGPDFTTVVILGMVATGVVLGLMTGPGLVVLGVIFWLVGRAQGRR